MDIKLTPERLDALRQIDTCELANAIEVFGERLRNEGIADSSVHCMFGSMPPMVGYAVTARIRFSNPSPMGHTYFERIDWWNHILNTPAPRVFVLQDVDERPGFGAFLGKVHTNILKALGCAGAVTNGSVRDLPAAEALGIPLFAGGVAVSHAYARFIDFGGDVEVGGLKIKPGDLLHGDRHGLISVPLQIAKDIPAVAAGMREIDQKREALDLAQERYNLGLSSIVELSQAQLNVKVLIPRFFDSSINHCALTSSSWKPLPECPGSVWQYH